ncbi:MAG: hypothetical protein ACXABY_00780 [Candidatus Thorarchaeota archaeon]
MTTILLVIWMVFCSLGETGVGWLVPSEDLVIGPIIGWVSAPDIIEDGKQGSYPVVKDRFDP